MDPHVKDLMLSLDEYGTIDSECTISEALQVLSKAQLGLTYDRHHHRAVLALDRSGNVVGKLTHWAILRALEPELVVAEDLEALTRASIAPHLIDSIMGRLRYFEGNLERLCRVAAQVRVCDAMVPAEESIDQEEPITAAIRVMVSQHLQSLLVTRHGKVVGILRLSDVFEEVADMIRRQARPAVS